MSKARDISRYGLGVGIQSAGSSISGVGITQLNFIGAGNTFRVENGTVDISIQGGGGIGIQSGGSQIGTGVTQLNFIGAGNTFRLSNGTVDISIQGGGGIGIQSGGAQIGTGVTQLNFIGAGNTFRVENGTVDVSIQGGGGGGGVSTTGILSCRAIANSALIFESIELGDSFAQGTNYAMIGPITIVGGGTTVTVGAGVSYVIV